MVVADPDKKHAVRIFFAVIVLFAIGAIVFITPPSEFPEHTVSDDFSSLLYAVSAITHGDIEGFFDGFVDGMPLLALFMVMFAIMHYLFSHVLSSIFPKKNVATMLALVMALYGFFDHRIYNQLLSLNAFALGGIVFSALVIMIWGFTETNIKGLQAELKDLTHKYKQGRANRSDVQRIKQLIRDIEREGKKPRS
ncbi:hypothetical protein K9M74_01460 [Candidatus Woesearchaeota archaeon]|nr:hypothetical protein [Candidatus Woesearchaeota archaeon]